MAENGNGKKESPSTEELLKALGQAIYQQGRHVKAIAENVEKLEKAVTGDLMEKLDTIAGAIGEIPAAGAETSARTGGEADSDEGEASPDAAPPAGSAELLEATKAIQTSVQSGFQGLEEISGKLDSLLEAVSGRGEQVEGLSEGLKELHGALKELHGAMEEIPKAVEGMSTYLTGGDSESLDEALETRMAELGETLQKGLSDLEELIGGGSELLSEKLSVLQTLKEGLDKVGETAVALREGLSGMEESVPGLAEKLDSLSGQVKEGSEALRESMDSLPEKNRELLDEQMKGVRETVDRLPEAVERMSESLGDRIGELDRDTTGKVEEISAAVSESGERLSAMEENIRTAAETQQRQLGEMTELLQTHRDTVRASQVDDLNRQAINHYGNGEYDLALEALERAREIQEDRPEILANLGHVYAALGEMDKAEASFRSALEADPELEPALSGLGALLVTDGRPDETIEFLRSFVEDAEPSSGVLLAYTRALAAQGSHARAVELLRKALQTDPGNPEIEEELGRYTD